MEIASGEIPPVELRQNDKQREADHRDRAHHVRRANAPRADGYPQAVGAREADNGAGNGVEDEVQRGDEPVPRLTLSGPPPQEAEDREVQQHLVDHRRVRRLSGKRLAGRRACREPDPPRQARGKPEGVAVHQIAHPSDRLSEDQRRRQGIAQRPKAHALPAGIQQDGEQTPNDAAVDREPTLPELDDVQQVLAVVAPLEDDVVEPGADERRRDHPQQKVEEVLDSERKAAAAHLGLQQEKAEGNGNHVHQAVVANDNRTDSYQHRVHAFPHPAV